MPGPKHHRHPEWIQNEEKFRTAVEIGERLQKIGELLIQKGEFKLGTSLIKPINQTKFTIRFERMPKGELKFKCELKWEDGLSSTISGYNDIDLPIE